MPFRDFHRNRHPRFYPCSTIVLGLSLLLALTTANAQDQPDDVIRIRTDLITVPVAISDSHDHRISGLTAGDFVLLDGGRSAQIEYFASGAERVALVFLLDNSNSLSGQLARQREAAFGLFSRFGPGSSVALLRFGATVKTVAPFTTSTDLARAAFSVPVRISERTAIFDAAAAAVQAFATREDNSTERRIVILISDGLDTASRATAPQVIEAASRANVSFYVIQLPLFMPRDGRLVPRPASKGFRDLAEKTGGKYFVAGTAQTILSPASPVDLQPVFAAIEEDLRSQYVLGFYPQDASRDGQTHAVAVNLSKRNRRLKVKQARTNYNLKP